MNRLTKQEIEAYIKPENERQGLDAITREQLEAINLDDVIELVKDGDRLKTQEGKNAYKLDRFTPRAGSIYFKPSFAGRQVLLGRQGRKLFFSDGRWFASCL